MTISVGTLLSFVKEYRFGFHEFKFCVFEAHSCPSVERACDIFDPLVPQKIICEMKTWKEDKHNWKETPPRWFFRKHWTFSVTQKPLDS